MFSVQDPVLTRHPPLGVVRKDNDFQTTGHQGRMQVLSLQEALQKEMNVKNSTKCLPEFISLR